MSRRPTRHNKGISEAVFTANHFTDTDKGVQENKHAKTKYKSDKVYNLKTAKQNYPGSVASYDTRPGNEMGLFYNDNTNGPRNPHGANQTSNQKPNKMGVAVNFNLEDLQYRAKKEGLASKKNTNHTAKNQFCLFSLTFTSATILIYLFTHIYL